MCGAGVQTASMASDSDMLVLGARRDSRGWHNAAVVRGHGIGLMRSGLQLIVCFAPNLLPRVSLQGPWRERRRERGRELRVLLGDVSHIPAGVPLDVILRIIVFGAEPP